MCSCWGWGHQEAYVELLHDALAQPCCPPPSTLTHTLQVSRAASKAYEATLAASEQWKTPEAIDKAKKNMDQVKKDIQDIYFPPPPEGEGEEGRGGWGDACFLLWVCTCMCV